MLLSLRRFMSWIALSLLFSHPVFSAPKGSSMSTPSLRQKIGQMIMVGFHGITPQDSQVKSLSTKIEQGLVGGVIFFAYNLKTPEQVRGLTQHFKGLKVPHPVLLAIDQEGGKVQRLGQKNGYQAFESAKSVASTKSLSEAQTHYAEMAHVVKDAGFNVVFGPVVDLDHHPHKKNAPVNPVIGGLERAFSANPETVIDYGAAFIKAHQQQGILTSLKHFPGHGLAPSDTHIDLTDITKTFAPTLELAPYKALASQGLIDMVMTGHVMLRSLDSKDPATLSSTIIKKLLRQEGYDGVVITDDLFMGAIQKHYAFEDIILKAIDADVDILLFSINTAAQKGINEQDKKPLDIKVVEKIIDVIERAIQEGRLSESRIQKSYDRIVRMKRQLA